MSGLLQKQRLVLAHADLFAHPELVGAAKKTTLLDGLQPHLGSEGILLNEGKTKKVFCFPPALGIGLAFSKLARHTSEGSLIAFDFIEAEDRVEQYTQQILKHQAEGPYVFSAHSAGGVLTFGVAKALEAKGYRVSDLILFDAIFDYTRLELPKNTEYKADDGFQARLYAAAGIEDNEANQSYIEALKTRSKRYEAYYLEERQVGRINADVHYIIPSTVVAGISKEIHDAFQMQVELWKSFTTGTLTIYQGKGTHIEMIRGENVATNAEVFDRILRGL
jgi:thioesterase domain-containing protein